MDINVLFTSVGRRVELLRAFRAAYAKLGLQGQIHATDIDPLAAALGEADRVHLVPRFDDPAFTTAIVDICTSERIDIVLPLIDNDIEILSELGPDLARAGTRVLVPPQPYAGITADKYETMKLFDELGVASPRTWLPDSLQATDLSFPLFVKPRRGSAGEGAARARTPEELRTLLDAVEDPLVQELLPGPEITSDVLCDLNGEVRAVVSRRRIEVRSGEVSKGVTVHDPRIIEACVLIAKGLQAVGPITVQCMLRDDEPIFTEVNARFGGGVPLGLAAGVDSPEYLLAFAAGFDIDIPPLGAYRTGLYLTRYDASITLTEEEHAALAGSRLRSR